MGTGIDIKKRIAAKEEGVIITNDASSFNFTGAGATASVVGEEVTINIPGSIGSTAYYLNQTVTQSPYKEFSSIPTTAAEQDVATTVSAGGSAVIGAYQTPAGVPNTTSIPAGLWQFFTHLYSNSASDDWDVYVEVYKRDLGGIETLLFTTDVEAVTNMSTSTTMYLLDGVFPTTSLLTTDRLVVKVVADNTGSGSQTIHMVTEGSAHYSVGTTTLNQVVGAGSVTAVTGTAPIASSGGTTPAISIPQATSLVNGYLSAIDWTTFNGKQDALTLTTTGTSGAATLVGSTLNIPQYVGGLIYFTEAQSTAAPNATVNVDSLTAVASTTNADIAIVPKGTGAFTLAIPDNTATGGNKRGSNAVDLQTSRTNANQVASGQWSFAAGRSNRASGSYDIALGVETVASGGLGAMAVGYGSQATASYSYSFGYGNAASGLASVAIGYGNGASASNSVAMGSTNIASGAQSVAMGNTNIANAENSTAFGYYSRVFGVRGRWVTGQVNTNPGDCQKSIFCLSARTTDATATTVLSGYGAGAPSATNQINLQNQSAYAFEGKIIGKKSGTTDVAMWKVEGLIVRGANAASTVLTASTVTLFSNLPGWGTPTLAADTTNGGLQVQVSGLAATNIQWTAVIETTEVIYA